MENKQLLLEYKPDEIKYSFLAKIKYDEIWRILYGFNLSFNEKIIQDIEKDINYFRNKLMKFLNISDSQEAEWFNYETK